MAKTTQSNLRQKEDVVGNIRRNDSINAEGRARWISDIVETTTDNVANDVIEIKAPPAGALIDKSRSFVVVETAPAGTVTGDIGIDGTADNLSDGMALASAGKVAFNVASNAAGADLVEVPAGTESLSLKLLTMTTPVAGKLRVSICYYVR